MASKSFKTPSNWTRRTKTDSERFMDAVADDDRAVVAHLNRCLGGKVTHAKNGSVYWNRKTSRGHLHLSLHSGGFSQNESGALHVVYESDAIKEADGSNMRIIFPIVIHANSSGKRASINAVKIPNRIQADEIPVIMATLGLVQTCLTQLLQTMTLGGRRKSRKRSMRKRSTRKRL